jgi:hypothetical protein
MVRSVTCGDTSQVEKAHCPVFLSALISTLSLTLQGPNFSTKQKQPFLILFRTSSFWLLTPSVRLQLPGQASPVLCHQLNILK